MYINLIIYYYNYINDNDYPIVIQVIHDFSELIIFSKHIHWM